MHCTAASSWDGTRSMNTIKVLVTIILELNITSEVLAIIVLEFSVSSKVLVIIVLEFNISSKILQYPIKIVKKLKLYQKQVIEYFQY